MAETYTIKTTRKGKAREVAGTVDELIEYFSYTLEAGNSWNSKINLQPKTAVSLVSNLNKAVSELQSGSYNPDYYELVD